MIDVTGRELTVGDLVAYCSVGYSSLQTGFVIKVTPKGATIGSTKKTKRGLPRASSQLCKIA